MRVRGFFTVMAVVCALSHGATRSAAAEEFRFSSYQQVLDLFERVDYTPKAWQAGIRVVPRVYLSNIPERWRGGVSDDVTVQLKKRLFFRLLAPLVLRSNELIAQDRERLLVVAGKTDRSGDEKAWLVELAGRYRVTGNKGAVDLDNFDAVVAELKRRVDVVPVSLALAQGAEESGWGTSRFADLGNAVFGQWTWGAKGITPAEQRANKGNYKIAAFDSPFGSVQAYMRNINTNAAYADLRVRRATMREDGEPLSGWTLAGSLTRYSERGEAYVDSLHELMRFNRLQPADTAFLGDGPDYILRPVGDGAE